MKLPPELSDVAQLRDARVTRVLRDLPQRRVLEVLLGGRRVYLKQFRDGDPAAKVLALQARLARAAQCLGQTRNAVAMPIFALPEHGTIVLEAASGLRLSDALTLGNRGALIARTGEWLRKLSMPTRQTGSFGPRFWLQALEAKAQADAPDEMVRAHMRRMTQLAEPLRGVAVLRASLHGDLTPDNLFHDDKTGRMTGIDLHGGGEIPVARDMARLLVWLESRREVGTGPRRSGIDATDHAALCAVPRLLPSDQQPILHFMIGEIALAYYLDARSPMRRAILARMMQAWA